jgi:hypothetical protein
VKHQLVPSRIQVATSQKAAIFKLVAVETLKLIFNFFLENSNRKQIMEIATTLMANCIYANASSYHSEKLNGLLQASQENLRSKVCMR